MRWIFQLAMFDYQRVSCQKYSKMMLIKILRQYLEVNDMMIFDNPAAICLMMLRLFWIRLWNSCQAFIDDLCTSQLFNWWVDNVWCLKTCFGWLIGYLDDFWGYPIKSWFGWTRQLAPPVGSHWLKPSTEMRGQAILETWKRSRPPFSTRCFHIEQCSNDELWTEP